MYIADFNLALVHLALYIHKRPEKAAKEQEKKGFVLRGAARLMVLVPKVVYVKPRPAQVYGPQPSRSSLLFTRVHRGVEWRRRLSLVELFGHSLENLRDAQV